MRKLKAAVEKEIHKERKRADRKSKEQKNFLNTLHPAVKEEGKKVGIKLYRIRGEEGSWQYKDKSRNVKIAISLYIANWTVKDHNHEKVFDIISIWRRNFSLDVIPNLISVLYIDIFRQFFLFLPRMTHEREKGKVKKKEKFSLLNCPSFIIYFILIYSSIHCFYKRFFPLKVATNCYILFCLFISRYYVVHFML